MLEGLRNFVGSWVAKILLGLLVISFAVWGVAGSVFQGAFSNTVVQVGETEVSVVDYVANYNRNLNQISRSVGRRLTTDEARAFGVEARTMTDVVTAATLDEYTRELSMSLSESRMAQIIGSDPAFQGSDGKFSAQRFQQAVYQAGLREGDFVRLQNGNAKRSQVMAGIAAGNLLPDAFTAALSRFTQEERKFEHVLLTAAQIDPIPAPTAGQLKEFFEANVSRYAAPEFRKLAILSLEPKDIADEASVSDEDVRADYESRIDAYRQEEKRRVQQVVLSKKQAEKALADMKAGSTFDTILSDNNVSAADADLGLVAKSALPKALQDAAFGLDLNGVSEVIDGPFGQTILRVIEIQPEQVRPLSEVNSDIRKDLALRQAADQIINLQSEIEDARAGGASLTEAAERIRQKVRIVEAIDATARDPEGNIISDIPNSRNLLQEAFQVEIGEQTAPMDLNDAGYVWVDVVSIEDARDRTQDEVTTRLEADWKADQEEKAVAAKADELKKRVEGGATLTDIAAELTIALSETQLLNRSGGEANFPAPAVTAGFAGPINTVAVADGQVPGSKILLKVLEVKTPEAQASETVAQQVEIAGRGAANDLLEQMVVNLQRQYSVTANQQLAQQAITRARN